MFLKRLAQTAGAVAAVAVCAAAEVHVPQHSSIPKLQRQPSSPDQQTQFKSLASDVHVRAIKLLTDDDWKFYQDAGDVKVFHKKSADQNGEVYRVDLTVDSTLEKAVPILLDVNTRVLWDKDVKETVVEEVGEGIAILHTTYEVSGIAAKIMSPRDFCRIELFERHGNGVVSLTYDNVDHPGCEPKSGFVRGQMYTSGMFCEQSKKDPTKTHIIFIFQSDPKVYIPGYLLHVTSCKRGFEMAADLKKAFDKSTQ